MKYKYYRKYYDENVAEHITQDEAKNQLAKHYVDITLIMGRLESGHPVSTPYAVYNCYTREVQKMKIRYDGVFSSDRKELNKVAENVCSIQNLTDEQMRKLKIKGKITKAKKWLKTAKEHETREF